MNKRHCLGNALPNAPAVLDIVFEVKKKSKF